jgi:hypothetical protein
MPSNAAFHPTIETVGFQTAFSVNLAPSALQEGEDDPLQIGL